MAEAPQIRRLRKVAVELNVGVDSIVKFLELKGIKVDSNPNAKIDNVAYHLLLEEFQSEKEVKEESRLQGMKDKLSKATISIDDSERRTGNKAEEEEFTIRGIGEEEIIRPRVEEKGPTVVGRVDLESLSKKTKPEKKGKKPAPDEEKPQEVVPEKEIPAPEPKDEPKDKWTGRPLVKDEEVIKAHSQKLEGPKVVGKMDLPVVEPKKKPVATSGESHQEFSSRKRKRKRIRKKIDKVDFREDDRPKFARRKKEKGHKAEVSSEEVDKSVKETLEQLSGAGKSKASK